MNSVLQVLRDVIREELGIEPPAPDTDLIASGLFDSLELAILLVEVEHRLDVRIPLGSLDLDSVRTVERIATLVARASAAA